MTPISNRKIGRTDFIWQAQAEIVKVGSMNVLFLCSQNKWRSPTAEHIFAKWPNVETGSAGLNSGAEVEISTEHIEWADIIFVMEKFHRTKLARKFKKNLKDKRVVCLDISDNFQYMDAELVTILQAKVPKYLR